MQRCRVVGTGDVDGVISLLLYSSTAPMSGADDIPADANSYQPFKVVDNAVTKIICEELDALMDEEEEGAPFHCCDVVSS